MRSRPAGARVYPIIVVALLAISIHVAADSAGLDWPQFRGINRDGISSETGLLSSWPENGPKEVWRHPIGEGYSGMAIVGDRLYTMYAGEHEGQPMEFAAAMEAGTGKEIWRVPIGEKYDTEFGNGPRATPTIDGDTVYVLGSRGDLAALSAQDGTERWRMNLTETFGSTMPHWGFATSALVDGEQLIIEGGGPEGKSYAALDKKTGDVKWTHGDGGRQPSYNSALMVEMNGTRGYVYVVGDKLTCLDPTGAEVWTYPWPRGETHAMPLFVAPDKIFASGAEGVGAALVRITEDGDKAKAEEVWQTRFMRNHFSSSVVQNGHIYGFDNATLKCLSVEDGEMAWAKRGLGKGSLILADGHLLVLSDQGQLLLLKATPDGYEEKGSIQALEGKSWTSPTLSHGRLYLRNHTEIVSYDLAD
jgi:outer membrane protein assembly factor BamB